MSIDWRKALPVTILAVLVFLLAKHQQGLALAFLAAVAAGLSLAGRAKWARYREGGRIAQRRRRKHQGWASRRELGRARAAAARLTRRICPGASLLHLGTSRRRPVAVTRENSALYVGVPGAGKTAALACHAADAPGLLFCSSTKTGLLRHTVGYRPGRTWVLNADGYGSIPSTLAWSPVDGCDDPVTAERRAGDLMAASPRDKSGQHAYHEDRGAALIQYMLRAAAAVGATMDEVNAWVCDPRDRAPMVILEAVDPQWADELAVMTADEQQLLYDVASAKAALGWMLNPVMRAAACPPPGHGFDMAAFARSADSVYLVGKKRTRGSLAPYFAAFGAELFEQLKQHAEDQGGQLPVPATFVLDEMPLTCPMPLHDMLAESREPLITIIAAVQTLAQLRAKFGQDDGDTIRSACPVEVYYGGEKRIEDLEAVSEVVGDYDSWQGDMRNLVPEPLLPPGALRIMKKGRAVILMPECRPVKAVLPAIWNRRGHQQVGADHPALRALVPGMLREPRVLEPSAVEPPRRAIPMPAAPAIAYAGPADLPVRLSGEMTARN